MTDKGKKKVHSEIVTDTIITKNSITSEETVAFQDREVYFIIDSVEVSDQETNEATISIIKNYLFDEDLKYLIK